MLRELTPQALTASLQVCSDALEGCSEPNRLHQDRGYHRRDHSRYPCAYQASVRSANLADIRSPCLKLRGDHVERVKQRRVLTVESLRTPSLGNLDIADAGVDRLADSASARSATHRFDAQSCATV